MIPNRIVLDTNVCLDLFVFRDPRWASLLEAMEAGHVQAVTRADCRDEWMIVLDYAHLPLDAATRATAVAAFDRLIKPAPATPAGVPLLLPRCSDKDDQKFLELARDARAAVLITKDRALLKLARKIARAGLFAIVKPEIWLAASASPTLAAASAAPTKPAGAAVSQALDRSQGTPPLATQMPA